jgi:hypothetical protein
MSAICAHSAHINHDHAYYTHSSPGKQAQKHILGRCAQQSGAAGVIPAASLRIFTVNSVFYGS